MPYKTASEVCENHVPIFSYIFKKVSPCNTLPPCLLSLGAIVNECVGYITIMLTLFHRKFESNFADSKHVGIQGQVCCLVFYREQIVSLAELTFSSTF